MNNADLCLPATYTHRPENNASLVCHDGGQWRVYRYAARLPGRTVLDYGTGSGADLIKYFGKRNTVGADMPFRLPALRIRFPNRRWVAAPCPAVADLVLCVDVIEHVEDPLELLRHFATGRWQHLVISTPERNLVARYKCQGREAKHRQRSGPPRNPHHVREWTQAEFRQLIAREFRQEPRIRVLGRFNLLAHLTRNLERPPESC